ncbi:MAG: hypothetical protein R6V05_09035 [Candidatus Brocadiia bacterium]
MREFWRYAWRILVAGVALAGITLLSLMVLSRFEEFPQPPAGSASVLPRIFVAKALVGGVLAYAAFRSRWGGTQLVAAVFVAYFGLYTFLPQMEARLLLAEHITPATSAVITAHGFLVGLVFALFLLPLSGSPRASAVLEESPRLHMGARQWVLRVLLCVGGWLAMKAGGAFVLGEAYEISDGLGILYWSGIRLLEALLLLVFALPLVKMLEGGRLEAALVTALCMAILAAVAPIVVAQAYVPVSHGMLRMAEMGLTDFLYGALVGFLFSYEAPSSPAFAGF